jgi:hypothetical protein
MPSAGRIRPKDIALRVGVPLVAAGLAALGAHVAIDVAGDFLLPHDAYDAPAHGSRWIASIALAATVLAVAGALLRAALAESRGSRFALRAALLASVPRGAGTMCGYVAALALPMLAGMAAFDAATAGAAIDSGADLFGGSIPLGLSIALGFAVVAGIASHAGIRALAAGHRALVRAVESFVRLRNASRDASRAWSDWAAPDRPRVEAALYRSIGANRAPPASAALVSLSA